MSPLVRVVVRLGPAEHVPAAAKESADSGVQMTFIWQLNADAALLREVEELAQLEAPAAPVADSADPALDEELRVLEDELPGEPVKAAEADAEKPWACEAAEF